MEPNLSKADFLLEDGHGYGVENAQADLAKVHQVYRDMLNALITSCKQNRVLLSKNDMEIAMQGVGEALADEADSALNILEDETYTPADCDKLIAKAHESLIDYFRPVKLDYSLHDMLRPGDFNTAFSRIK